MGTVERWSTFSDSLALKQQNELSDSEQQIDEGGSGRIRPTSYASDQTQLIKNQVFKAFTEDLHPAEKIGKRIVNDPAISRFSREKVSIWKKKSLAGASSEKLQFPVLHDPPKKLKEYFGGSHLYDEATAFTSWHFGKSSQDDGGQMVNIIQVDHQGHDDHDSASSTPIQLVSPALNNSQACAPFQGNKACGYLGYMSENEVPAASLNENINTAAPQNNSFIGISKKTKEPRYNFLTSSEIDILDDGYRWRKYGQMGDRRIRPYYLAQSCAQKAVRSAKWSKTPRWRRFEELYTESVHEFPGVPLGVGATASRSRRHLGWSAQCGGGEVHIIQVERNFARSVKLMSPSLIENTPSASDQQSIRTSAPPEDRDCMNKKLPFDMVKPAKMFLLISTEEGLALLAIWFSVGDSLSANARILLCGAGICSAVGRWVSFEPGQLWLRM